MSSSEQSTFPINLVSSEGAVSPTELAHCLSKVAEHVLAEGARRVLLVPPDLTRLHGQGGAIIARLDGVLRDRGVAVDVVPALGTHRPFTAAEADLLFEGGIPVERLQWHDWRRRVVTLGEISAEEVDAIAERRLGLSLPVTVSNILVDPRYDFVISAGEVVPHEVAGFSGYTKQLCIGLGGGETIQRTHFISAIYGIDRTLGRIGAPVRRLIDLAFDRFIGPRCRVMFILTVVEGTAGDGLLRGVFAGEGGTSRSGGAAFRAAAALAESVNITAVAEPFGLCVARLDPVEFRSFWLGNKAIYRTRLAMAEGGELVVLAPGVERFGEDPIVDRLIRRHGYHGVDAALAAMDTDPELRANLAAVAHLAHGSTEGRFKVTYSPSPKLTRADVEGAGFGYLSAAEAQLRYPLGGGSLPHVDSTGRPFVFIPDPALGLWRATGR
jgi:nickel-dependent lactate racemase